MPAPAINLCERKQAHFNTSGKTVYCPEIDGAEMLSENVCPECSIKIYKMEKRFEIISRLMEAGYGHRAKPMAPLRAGEVQLWRFWRQDREKFRKLGVWGGDANGEIGPWSLAGWDGHSAFHPSKPGARSLRSHGGGFQWAFYWDPFLGGLDDQNDPNNDDTSLKGMEKLLGNDRCFEVVVVGGDGDGDDGKEMGLEVVKSGEEVLEEIKRECELRKREGEARGKIGVEESADGNESEILFLRWKNK